jgi:signal transduction histidine kinase
MTNRAAELRRGSALGHLAILRAVAQAVNGSLDLDEVIHRSIHALTQVTAHELASLHLISPDGERLLLRGERGLSDPLREVVLVLPVGHGLIGQVAATGTTRRLEDSPAADNLLPRLRPALLAEGVQGVVCVPMRARDRVLGTLSLGRRTGRRFDDGEVLLLECTADQIGLALDNARLYSESRRQLEELRHTQETLIRAERLSAVGELAAGVAHEINNPLMIIQAQTYLLLESSASDEGRTGLRTIENAIRRAAAIVRDLMAFAEPSPPHRTLCRLADHVRRVLSLRERQMRGDGIEVRTDFQEAPAVWADASQLHEVLFNLIRNGHQAMTGANRRGILTVRVRGVRDGARVEVEDEGPGVPEHDRPRLFTPFFTTKGPGDGRGLGLSVSHAMVAEHGGRLWVEDRLEGGARFILEMPVGAPLPSPRAG